MIFYCLMMLCITSIINCADTTKPKTPDRGARAQEVISPTRKFEDKEEKKRIQNKKKSQKTDMKHSLKSLTGSYEHIEDALDRLMT